MKAAFLVSVLATLFATAPASATPATDNCAFLDQLLRNARADFTALKDTGFGGATCRYRGQEFKCVWGFGTPYYDQAESQRERLERCTAAQPNAKLLGRKGDETLFELNPETRMAIGGPDPEDGHWTIELKITTTADWD